MADELLQTGQSAPDFELPASNGGQISLGGLRGTNVVLFFYPVDDTPGWTKEAIGFRDAKPKFDELNAILLGISRDDLSSHHAFIEKYDLNMTLLTDSDGSMCQAYGVCGDGNDGFVRSTIVIDGSGNVAKIMRAVDPVEHIAIVETFIHDNLQ